MNVVIVTKISQRLSMNQNTTFPFLIRSTPDRALTLSPTTVTDNQKLPMGEQRFPRTLAVLGQHLAYPQLLRAWLPEQRRAVRSRAPAQTLKTKIRAPCAVLEHQGSAALVGTKGTGGTAEFVALHNTAQIW